MLKLELELIMDKKEWVQWLQDNELDKCFWCGLPDNRPHPLQTHHIAKGAGRKDDLCNLVRVCQNCHAIIHESPDVTVAHELAIKALGDGEHHDRRRVNQLRSRAPEAIEEYEVVQACMTLKDIAWELSTKNNSGP